MKKHKYLFIVVIIMIIALLSSCNQTETITCGECGADVSGNAIFCTKCGSSATTEASLAPEATQATEDTEPPYVQAPDSVGLAYEINSDGKTCTITGIGNCEDSNVLGSFL